MALLTPVLRFPSVERAVITGPEGLVIEAGGLSGPDPEFLAAEIAAAVRALSPFSTELDEPLQRFVIGLADRELLAVVQDGVYVGAVVRKGPERRQVGATLVQVAAAAAREFGGA